MERVDPELTRRARELRNNATKAERLLWLRLRHYRPRFTRQLVVDPYIVDLACREATLAVEVDGGQHSVAAAYDGRRTAFLQEQGWMVIRLWNMRSKGIQTELPSSFFVTAMSALTALPTPNPSLVGRGGRGVRVLAWMSEVAGR